jgi:hypothetical protein
MGAMNAQTAWPVKVLLVLMAIAIAVLAFVASTLSTRVHRLDSELADLRLETESLQAALDAERARSDGAGTTATLNELAERLVPSLGDDVREFAGDAGDMSIGEITDMAEDLGQGLCDIPGNDWC